MASMGRSKPHWLQFVVFSLVVAAVIAGYIAALRLTLDGTRIDADTTANQRDTVLLAIHGIALVAALVLGFAVGKWLNGLGFAYAVLAFLLLCLAMGVTTAGSQALACRGDRNDLVRHWHC